MRGIVLAAVVGVVAGTLFSFGCLNALFDWAHPGPNTRLWQAVAVCLATAFVVGIPALLPALAPWRCR